MTHCNVQISDGVSVNILWFNVVKIEAVLISFFYIISESDNQ